MKLIKTITMISSIVFVLSALTLHTCFSVELESLAGKQIYRDVPVKTNTAYNESHMNTVYKLFAYDKHTITIEKDENQFMLGREFWDDGNWKEWKQIKKDALYQTTQTMFGTRDNFIVRMDYPYEPPSSIEHNRYCKLNQWDHVYINYNRSDIKTGHRLECGHILMFYNLNGESCFNRAVVRLCNENNQSKYRRDTITYQNVDWLKKTSYHHWFLRRPGF